MERTSLMRTGRCSPVFLALTHPFGGLKSSTIAKIMEQGIVQAGLSGLGFSAKSYRPTGATYAIDAEIDAEIIMEIGRWKTRPVFYEHYVHSKTPANYTDKVLSETE